MLPVDLDNGNHIVVDLFAFGLSYMVISCLIVCRFNTLIKKVTEPIDLGSISLF